MEEIFNLVGSFSSISGIPLAIYLYIVSKEKNFYTIKKEIVKILSFQIGEERKITSFEIQSVINSKLRENGIRFDKVLMHDIVEDLVSGTISNPMLDKSRKHMILEDLKGIHYSGELQKELENLKIEVINNEKKIISKDLEGKIISIIDKSKNAKKTNSNARIRNSKQVKLSHYFKIAVIILIILSLIVFQMPLRFKVYNYFIEHNTPPIIVTVLFSLALTLLSLLFAFSIKKIQEIRTNKKA